MSTRTSIPTLALIFTLFLAVPGLQAQQADAEGIEQELREMVAAPTDAEQDRRVILDFLERTDVRGVASSHGFDLERLERGVTTLDAEDAGELSRKVQDTRDQLDMVGGDTFVISSTLVIIILLVLILVAVA